MAHEYMNPPFVTALFQLFCFMLLSVCGHARDILLRLFYTREHKTREGYCPILSKAEDFYQRRFFKRVCDCYNHVIGSAPDAWVDVMERVDVTGMGACDQQLELTGKRNPCVNLGSYNYLGFAAQDEYCTPRVLETYTSTNISNCSSRSCSGTMSIHQELEKLVARYVGAEDSITLSMGFATNTSALPSMMGKGCLVISDALNHASIVFGARLSGAKIKVFRHNDVQHLEAILRESIAEGQPATHRPWKKVFILIEGIYSMEGEVSSLPQIVALKKKYKAYLYLDEAHSIGAMGPTGRGVCEHWGVDPRDIDILMGTFTKSFGSCGGYIAGSKQLIDHLRRNLPGHLYASSMPAGCAQQVVSSLKVIMGEDGTDRGAKKIKQLHDNSNYFRRRLLEMGFTVIGSFDSPVMPLMLYHPSRMKVVTQLCLKSHIAMVVVGSPATPLLLSRARVCISASHTKEDLDYALEHLLTIGQDTKLMFHDTRPLLKLLDEDEKRIKDARQQSGSKFV
mmetsp:Transcript_19262/g.34826  ORF Transcript_19262/g.34826 Transcript_19262/m.34826 type:complete len:509 (-) Transcript_19262:541-2067(-)